MREALTDYGALQPSPVQEQGDEEDTSVSKVETVLSLNNSLMHESRCTLLQRFHLSTRLLSHQSQHLPKYRMRFPTSSK